MKGSEFLLCIAQVGITFAGFTGLIGVFRPPQAMWQRQDIRGLYLILHYSLGAVVFALLPFPLLGLLKVEPRVWAFCSALLATGLLVKTLEQLYAATRLRPRRPWVLYPVLLGTLIITGLLFYGACAGGTQTIYETGLLWLLAASGVQFLAFVSYLESPETYFASEADHGSQHTAQPDAPADAAERRR